MTKFKFEHQKPDNILQRTIEKGVTKIKQLISEENFKINPRVLKKTEVLISKMQNKNNIKIKAEEVLKDALEMIYKEQGAFPQELEQKYSDLVAQEIVNEIIAGENNYQVFREKGVELKRKGIQINDGEIEKRVKKLLRLAKE